MTRKRHKPRATELVVCTSSSSSIAMTAGIAVHMAVHGDSAPSLAEQGLMEELITNKSKFTKLRSGSVVQDS